MQIWTMSYKLLTRICLHNVGRCRYLYNPFLKASSSQSDLVNCYIHIHYVLHIKEGLIKELT